VVMVHRRRPSKHSCLPCAAAPALSESSNQRSLKELTEVQLHEVCARLQKFKSNIARAWTSAEIEGLVTIWAELQNG
jgi:hypothetical protein